MTLIEELKFRGFLNQCTNEETLNEIINSNKIKFYIGFDCTAKSLHVGSLIQIMIMRLFQKYGHTPIVLIGKGTTRIGDPSGKDETRKILSDDEIDLNAKNLKQVFDRFLLSDNEVSKWVTRDNSEWLDKLNYVNFLRDYGKHFTINKMLSFDSVKIRLDREQSLNFVEFNYMIFQAYDFFELNNRDNCILQIGGSDQWGNIVNGVELIRRASGKETFGLTTRRRPPAGAAALLFLARSRACRWPLRAGCRRAAARHPARARARSAPMQAAGKRRRAYGVGLAPAASRPMRARCARSSAASRWTSSRPWCCGASRTSARRRAGCRASGARPGAPRRRATSRASVH